MGSGRLRLCAIQIRHAEQSDVADFGAERMYLIGLADCSAG